MRVFLALMAVMVMAGPASAFVWSDGDAIDSFSAATGNRDGVDGDSVEAPNWSPDFQVLSAADQIADGWYFAEHWGDGSLDVSHVDGGMRMQPHEYEGFNDTMVGVKIEGLTIGELYTINFDMKMDPSLMSNGNVGSYAGETGPSGQGDHLTQVNAMIRNSAEATGQVLSKGLMTPSGFWDMEDWTGNPRGNTLWIGEETGGWDGNWHTHTMQFTPLGTEVAFILKLRARDCDGTGGAWYIDNLVVTPEPVSLAMLALGGLALVRRRAR